MGWWRRAFEPPEGWEAVAGRRLVHFAALDADERAQLGADIGRLLAEKRWEAARGFELTDEMRLTIAAQAALLILGLDLDGYREVGIDHRAPDHDGAAAASGPVRWPAWSPTTRCRSSARPTTTRAGDHRLGRGRRDARHPERGPQRGVPRVRPQARHARRHRRRHPAARRPGACSTAGSRSAPREYEAVRRGEGGHLLRAYAGTNPGEFFAVATEVFFDRPVRSAAEKPDLYDGPRRLLPPGSRRPGRGTSLMCILLMYASDSDLPHRGAGQAAQAAGCGSGRVEGRGDPVHPRPGVRRRRADEDDRAVIRSTAGVCADYPDWPDWLDDVRGQSASDRLADLGL